MEKLSKDLGVTLAVGTKTLHGIKRVPPGSHIGSTVYNIGKKPIVMLYTYYINRHFFNVTQASQTWQPFWKSKHEPAQTLVRVLINFTPSHLIQYHQYKSCCWSFWGGGSCVLFLFFPRLVLSEIYYTVNKCFLVPPLNIITCFIY